MIPQENNPQKLLEATTRFIDQHKLVPPNATIVIGLSGGPDSVFLLHLLASLKPTRNLTLVAAHLDHGWRAESQHDVLFCQKLAESLGVFFVAGHARDFTQNVPGTGSLEALGRTARRAFFEQVVQNYGAQSVALGHHADDQLETFFIRLTRGAGVTGLAGILPKNGQVIHPLLSCQKTDILDFLQQQQIPYLTDSTNADRRFLRNRIRHDVIPALKEADQRFGESAQKTIRLLQKTNTYIEQETERALTQLGHLRQETYWIDIKKLLALHPFMRDQVILAWLIKTGVPFAPSQELIEEIVRFLGNNKSSSHTFYQSWQITKKQWYACIKDCQ